jgi:hypothetical protein
MVNYFRDTLLPEVAYAFALEIHGGDWKSSSAATERDEMLKELQRRCPGLGDAEYSEALAKALHASK